MDVTDFILFGIFVLCGLWQLLFPNSVLRFYERFYWSRLIPRPFFIRLTGGFFVALALWLFFKL
jgi:hypothetical protein